MGGKSLLEKTGTNIASSIDIQGPLDACCGIQDNKENTWGINWKYMGIKRNNLGIKRKEKVIMEAR